MKKFCIKWRNTGTCSYGNACRFLHEIPQNARKRTNVDQVSVERSWVQSQKKNETWNGELENFRLMSYNILADELAHEHRFELYPEVAKEHLQWSYRLKLILAEVRQHQPTVLCLQEVDHFDDLQTALQEMGYQGLLCRRTGDRGDGAATFWKVDRARLLQHYPILFKKLDLKDNVALIVVLEMLEKASRSHTPVSLPNPSPEPQAQTPKAPPPTQDPETLRATPPTGLSSVSGEGDLVGVVGSGTLEVEPKGISSNAGDVQGFMVATGSDPLGQTLPVSPEASMLGEEVSVHTTPLAQRSLVGEGTLLGSASTNKSNTPLGQDPWVFEVSDPIESSGASGDVEMRPVTPEPAGYEAPRASGRQTPERPELGACDAARADVSEMLVEPAQAGHEAVRAGGTHALEGLQLGKLDAARAGVEEMPVKTGLEEVSEAARAVKKQAPLLVVANTHILFNTKRGDVKLGQVRNLTEAVADVQQRLLNERGGRSSVAMITGDFNSVPGSGIYHFLERSFVDLSVHDRYCFSGQLEGYGYRNYIHDVRRGRAKDLYKKLEWSFGMELPAPQPLRPSPLLPVPLAQPPAVAVLPLLPVQPSTAAALPSEERQQQPSTAAVLPSEEQLQQPSEVLFMPQVPEPLLPTRGITPESLESAPPGVETSMLLSTEAPDLTLSPQDITEASPLVPVGETPPGRMLVSETIELGIITPTETNTVEVTMTVTREPIAALDLGEQGGLGGSLGSAPGSVIQDIPTEEMAAGGLSPMEGVSSAPVLYSTPTEEMAAGGLSPMEGVSSAPVLYSTPTEEMAAGGVSPMEGVSSAPASEGGVGDKGVVPAEMGLIPGGGHVEEDIVATRVAPLEGVAIASDESMEEVREDKGSITAEGGATLSSSRTQEGLGTTDVNPAEGVATPSEKVREESMGGPGVTPAEPAAIANSEEVTTPSEDVIEKALEDTVAGPGEGRATLSDDDGEEIIYGMGIAPSVSIAPAGPSTSPIPEAIKSEAPGAIPLEVSECADASLSGPVGVAPTGPSALPISEGMEGEGSLVVPSLGLQTVGATLSPSEKVEPVGPIVEGTEGEGLRVEPSVGQEPLGAILSPSGGAPDVVEKTVVVESTAVVVETPVERTESMSTSITEVSSVGDRFSNSNYEIQSPSLRVSSIQQPGQQLTWQQQEQFARRQQQQQQQPAQEQPPSWQQQQPQMSWQQQQFVQQPTWQQQEQWQQHSWQVPQQPPQQPEWQSPYAIQQPYQQQRQQQERQQYGVQLPYQQQQQEWQPRQQHNSYQQRQQQERQQYGVQPPYQRQQPDWQPRQQYTASWQQQQASGSGFVDSSGKRWMFRWGREDLLNAAGPDHSGSAVQHPLQLASAYMDVCGHEPSFTSCHSRCMDTLDYVWYTPEACTQTSGPEATDRTQPSTPHLKPVAVLQPPDGTTLLKGMPNAAWPSDHISLVVDFALEY